MEVDGEVGMNTLITAAVTAFGAIAWGIIYMGYAHPTDYQKNVFQIIFRLGFSMLYILIAFYFGMLGGSEATLRYVNPQYIDKITEFRTNVTVFAGLAGLWIVGLMVVSIVTTNLKDLLMVYAMRFFSLWLTELRPN